MLNSNAVAAALVATNGVIDKMELEKDVFGAVDRAFLAEYQATLASAPTSAQDDLRFLGLFSMFIGKAVKN